MTSESAVASKVLWEFTDADMGFTYGQASIFKTEQYGWVVAIASGYNTPTGNGYIYLLNPKTGALHQKILVASGTADNEAGLAHLAAYVPDLGDYTSDSIYAGDLQGRVFRINLKGTVASYPVAQIATLVNGGKPQPITTPPEVQAMPGSQERFVFIGTGRYLHESDLILSQTQSLYAIRDGSRYAAQLTPHPTRPALASRSSMQVVTNLTTGITLNPDLSGWYYDLPNGSGGANERSVVAPVAFGGQVVWATVTPGSDPCSTNGVGRLYALSFMTGRTQLPTPNITVPSTIVRTKIVGAGSRVKVLATIAGIDGDTTPPPGCNGDFCQVRLTDPIPNQVQRLNLREIRPQ
jgi:type IV pilus assembly protein PilY1